MDISFQISLQIIISHKLCGDIYEFGVYNGNSLAYIKEICKYNNYQPENVYGFDSFEGCPKEENDHRSAVIWKEKFMDTTELYHEKSPSEVVEILEEKLKSDNFPIKLIAGYYSNTLNSDLSNSHDFKPASFINLDCDQYTSTYEALDFLFNNKLVKQDTIIRYDDWNAGLIYNDDIDLKIKSPFRPQTYTEYQSGQSRAHKELFEKYNIEAKRIYQDSPYINWKGKSVFMIDNVPWSKE
tara:strand:- start:3762 stop:4481 length:720 start_codon:yes stop_codon:yes gene_type:complete